MKKKFIDFLLKKVPDDYDVVSQTFSNSRHKPWAEFELYTDACFEGANVLVLGCGNGRLFFSLKEQNIKYIGLDNSAGLLDQAKESLVKEDVELIEGSFLDIPLPDNSVDLIFAVASFHHLPSNEIRLQALREMQRVLKPNGKLYISVWNLYQKRYFKFILESLFRLGSYDFGDTFIKLGGVKRYYHAFTPYSLSRLVSKSNFKLVNKHYYKNTQKTSSFWQSQNMIFELKLDVYLF